MTKKIVYPNESFISHSLNMTVKRFFTDVDGAIIAAPLALQLKYPVWLFGAFDARGGYKAAHSIAPPQPGSFYLLSFINGCGFTSQNIVGFSGLNQLQNQLTIGDLVSVFTDDLQNPNYFIWIVQQNSKQSVGAVLQNIPTTSEDNKFNRMFVSSIMYSTSNGNAYQWDEIINITRINNIGLINNNDYNPTADRTPQVFLNNILQLDLQFKVDQFIGLNTYMLYTTDQIQFDFKLKL